MALPNHPRVTEPTLKTLLPVDRPRAIGAGTSVLDALRQMEDSHQCALAVTDNGRLIGIFSEHDASRAIILGAVKPGDIPVGDAITRSDNALSPGTSLQQGLLLMAQKGLRHLPVVEGGELLGLVRREELLEELVSHHERVVHEMKTDWSILFLRGTYSC